jgi:hypothetical protein
MSDLHREQIKSDRRERTKRDLRTRRRVEGTTIRDKASELSEEVGVLGIKGRNSSVGVMEKDLDRPYSAASPRANRLQDCEFRGRPVNGVKFCQVDRQNGVVPAESPRLKSEDLSRSRIAQEFESDRASECASRLPDGRIARFQVIYGLRRNKFVDRILQ